MKLRAPFPWFGGKSRASSLIWEGLGDVPNYVEPFAGSLAVLLGRPTPARTETVNDLDCYVANFWRALEGDPERLAAAADWPVNEADLHARHRWLVKQKNFREKMRSSPTFFDVRVAGWWAWGLSCWIGGGWCSATEDGPPKGNGSPGGAYLSSTRPKIDRGGAHGVHRTSLAQKIPDVGSTTEGGHGRSSRRGIVALVERSVHEKRPATGNRGRGTHKVALGGHGHGLGVHSDRRFALVQEFGKLAERLRGVRVVCGDWKRVLTPAVTTGHGLTGIVLDPPYDQLERDAKIYACETNVSAEVRTWAIEHGHDPLMRIVLCGYDGEHAMPPSWRVVQWKAAGGYARAKRGVVNRHRERLWFSPACLSPDQKELFA